MGTTRRLCTRTNIHQTEICFRTIARARAVSTSNLFVCPNPACKEFTLTVSLFGLFAYAGSWQKAALRQSWRLIPPSNAKVYPDYIPQAIRDDYIEACLISQLSPKASATMSRRCLQGMIRDFWGIKKPKLSLQILELEGKVEAETWKAIDTLSKVGNIGAHMEQDVNVIIDVEPGEAEQLIWLVETLIADWYVSRHDRQQRLLGVSGDRRFEGASPKGRQRVRSVTKKITDDEDTADMLPGVQEAAAEAIDERLDGRTFSG